MPDINDPDYAHIYKMRLWLETLPASPEQSNAQVAIDGLWSKFDTLRAEHRTLRKIVSHISSRTVIEAKEAAGCATAIVPVAQSQPLDHIGPIDGFNFMSLNMTDEQLDTIMRAIIRAKAESPEAALADICNQYHGYMDWKEAGMQSERGHG